MQSHGMVRFNLTLLQDIQAILRTAAHIRNIYILQSIKWEQKQHNSLAFMSAVTKSFSICPWFIPYLYRVSDVEILRRVVCSLVTILMSSNDIGLSLSYTFYSPMTILAGKYFIRHKNKSRFILVFFCEEISILWQTGKFKNDQTSRLTHCILVDFSTVICWTSRPDAPKMTNVGRVQLAS